MLRLASSVEYPFFVGWAAGEAELNTVGAALLNHLDDADGPLVAAADGFARQRAQTEGWEWVRRTATPFQGRPVAVARVLLTADTLEDAWAFAQQDPAVDAAYWREFTPYGRGADFTLAEASARKLLDHDRPRAALMMMNLYVRSVEIDRELVMTALERLFHLPPDHHDQFRVDAHELEQLLDYVREGDIDEERLALLEWHLRPGLRFDAHSPTLEKRLATTPAFFVEVLSLAYKPRDGEPEQDVAPQVATNAWRLLNDWSVVPGSEEPKGNVDAERLTRWLEEVVPLLETAKRLEIGLDSFGRVLATAGGDEDGTWPTKPVRDVIEKIARSEVDDGFRIAVFNNRGVTSRAPDSGGDQERELASRYDALANLVIDRRPRTGAILRSIAAGYVDDAKRHDAMAERIREGLDR